MGQNQKKRNKSDFDNFLEEEFSGQQEEILKIKEEQYRKIFNKSPSGIKILDSQGNILKANESLCEITGYEKEELEGSNIFDILVPLEIEEEARENIKRILAGVDLSMTVKNRRKNGEAVHVHLSETRITLSDGSVGVLSMCVDISELKEKEKELKYLSYHDGLTGLYNRYYVEAEMERLDTKRQLPISVIMLDINGLKLVNDTYGHDKGDKLLIKVADIIRDNIRQEDIVARWAGDEFVIILPQTDKQRAQEICQRIDKACEEADFNSIPISLGMGSATKTVIDQDIFNMLNKADSDMYKDKLAKRRSAKHRLLRNLLNTLVAKSNETKGHAVRMTELAHRLGEEIGLNREQLKNLSMLATLHDIGKVTIPEEILTKPGRLSEDERKIVNEHPEKGYRIVASIDEYSHIAKYILHHHEKWDGSGYPEGLQGEDIPLLSRIITVVDAYDVMTGGRPYQKAKNREETLEELKKCAGSQLDPELVKVFVRLIEESEI